MNRAMKVGILVAFAGRNCGGPEVYERELVRSISSLAPQHEYHLFCLDKGAPAIIDRQGENLIYHMMRPSIRVVSMLTTLSVALARTRFDVFHGPVITPAFCPPRTIMAMPCSSLIRHPEFFPPLRRARLRFLLHRAVPKAAKIVCPSEHVRDVMQEHFGLPPDRLPIIHPGLSPFFRPMDENEKRAHVVERYGLHYPYFLFSGRTEQRKNAAGILEGFAAFKRAGGSEHRLVFTGGKGWDHAEVDAVIKKQRIEDSVVQLGKTDVDELPYLYGAADALVYASLWEGFGMPIVEAMACGTPVITSNCAAMPETAGGNAILVDPSSTEEIAAAMQLIANDSNLRKRLSEEGQKRAQRYSWEKTAKLTLQLYEEVANSGERPAAGSVSGSGSSLNAMTGSRK